MSLSRSESRKIASRYVEAFFDMALNAGQEEAVGDDFAALEGMIDDSDELKRLMHNPMISVEAKQAVFAELLKKAKANKQTLQFVDFLIGRKRLEALPDVAVLYQERLVAHKGEIIAEITAAHALTDKQIKSIAAAVKKAVGKDANIVTREDPAIIGGVIVKIGSRMLDHSVAGKLRRMVSQLKTQSLAT